MIDLTSDTVTRPSTAMLEAMVRAQTGDEQRRGDPTVNRLCDLFAERLGKEAAMFLPSGTMANQIAMLVHCRPGDEIIAADDVHISYSEGGGASALAGAQLRLLPHQGGHISAAAVEAAIRPIRQQTVRSRMVLVEQTANRAGGVILKLDDLKGIRQVADDHGLAVHMDGARLFNAEIGSGIEARHFAQTADTVLVDLTKGLGCPFGAVLAGTKDVIERAWRPKMLLGGGMRQAGIMAAAGIFALEHNVAALAQDHENAYALAEGLVKSTGLSVCLENVQTNIVVADCRETGKTAAQFCATLKQAGVYANPISPHEIRFVTHRDVSLKDVQLALEKISVVN